MYRCVCLCINIYIYIYIYAYIHIYRCKDYNSLSLHMYMCLHEHVPFVHIFFFVHIHVCRFSFVYIDIYISLWGDTHKRGWAAGHLESTYYLMDFCRAACIICNCLQAPSTLSIRGATSVSIALAWLAVTVGAQFLPFPLATAHSPVSARIAGVSPRCMHLASTTSPHLSA